ncbi:hypothetical protein [Acetobacter sp. DsW_063]|nr:hypothetical protein [Acetobacter sp. DsW_063]
MRSLTLVLAAAAIGIGLAASERGTFHFGSEAAHARVANESGAVKLADL